MNNGRKKKHIPPKFFSFKQELEKNNFCYIKCVCSCKNSTDFLIKVIPSLYSKNMFMLPVCGIYKIYEGINHANMRESFMGLHSFLNKFSFRTNFPCEIFNEATRTCKHPKRESVVIYLGCMDPINPHPIKFTPCATHNLHNYNKLYYYSVAPA